MTATSESAPVVLRLDDVGASTKRYEVYARFRPRLGLLGNPFDWLFIKYLPRIRAWGPYRELSGHDWEEIATLLARHNARLTVGVTAAWADDEQALTPYHARFPEAAIVLKAACQEGLIEIANHGLTHCVVNDNAFKPKRFASNRQYHREFGPLVSPTEQREHLKRSQELLQNHFGQSILTFIPPGHHLGAQTLRFALDVGLRYVSLPNCVVPIDWAMGALSSLPTRAGRETLIGPPELNTLALLASGKIKHALWAFHDRDVVLMGTRYLEDLFRSEQSQTTVTASDAARLWFSQQTTDDDAIA